MARNYQDIDRIVQSCLEALENDGESLDSVIARYPDLEASIRPPLEAALWLRRVKSSLDPTPEFVSASRERLMAQIQHGSVAGPPSREFSLRDLFSGFGGRRFAFQFALALLLLVFLVVGAGSAALAARNAMPGDSLYNLKLAQERVRLAFSFTPAGDARLHVQFAQERLVEIQRLVLEQRFEYLDQTVARYELEVAQAITLTRHVVEQDGTQVVALVDQIDATLSNQRLVLLTLSEQVPQDAQQDIFMALDRAEEGILELDVIRRQLIDSGLLTPTPTSTPTNTPAAIETRTAMPSPSDTELPPQLVGPTPTGTFGPAIAPTISAGLTPVPTQVSEPVNPPTGTIEDTPRPPTVMPKPPNTHIPSPRPTNTHRPASIPPVPINP